MVSSTKCIVFNVNAAVGMKKDIHPPTGLYDRVNLVNFTLYCMLSSVDL